MDVIGLISDTHMPKYCKQLPDTVFDIFAGVDLIIHAGDVGELWVLDELSRIAPVVAVHGNDETQEATNALPFLKTVMAAGHRIVITHGHHPDAEKEAAQRRDDRWLPKWETLVKVARTYDASVVIYGHSHIPAVYCHEDVWLINPGAIASAGVVYKQTIQTVARLTLSPNTTPQVQYFDVMQGGKLHDTSSDWENGFNVMFRRYSEPIFEPELFNEVGWIRENILPIAPSNIGDWLLPLAHECWSGKRKYITTADFVILIKNHPETSQLVLDKLSKSPILGRQVIGG